MKIRVTVMLKDGVLDPQGKAIEHALHSLGFENTQNIRVGRVIDMDVAGTDSQSAQKQGEEMGRQLLANGVIENFVVEVLG